MVVAVEMMLVCPRCNGRLRLEQESGQPDTLTCMACSREFPSSGALIKSPSGGVAVDYAKPKAVGVAAPRASRIRDLPSMAQVECEIVQTQAAERVAELVAPPIIETMPVVSVTHFEVVSSGPAPAPPPPPPPPEVFRNVHFKILMKSAAEYAQFMADCDDPSVFSDERIEAICKAVELAENRVAELPEDALKRMIAEAEAALNGVIVQFLEVSERKKEAEKRLVGLTRSLAAFQEAMFPGSMREAMRVGSPATRDAVEYIKEWAAAHNGVVRVSDLATHMAAMKGDPSKKSACENNLYRGLRRLGYILISRGFWGLP